MNARVALATLVVLACAGCGGGPPTASPSPTESVTPSATPTPTPTVASKPDLYDLVITPEGIGPLVIGHAPPVTDPAVDILVYVPDACAWAQAEEPSFPDSDLGKWKANYDIDLTQDTLGPFGVFVRDDGVLQIIGVYDERLRTETGAHLGMTRDELLAAYPSDLQFTAGEGLDVYRLRGIEGDLIFTLWDRGSGTYEVGQINISEPGFEVPLGGSDFGAFGLCYGP